MTRPAGLSVRNKVAALGAVFLSIGALSPAPVGAASGFDFYVLSLSWSPSYCAAEGVNADRRECAGGAFGFTVHGLWPQRERGYPADCATKEKAPDEAAIAALRDIMPGRGLIRHEWLKHGSCTGLSSGAYLRLLRRAWDRVTIPEIYRGSTAPRQAGPRVVESEFIAANPGLSSTAIAVSCDQAARLREVRICLTRELIFRACEEIDRGGCRRAFTVMPAPGASQ